MEGKESLTWLNSFHFYFHIKTWKSHKRKEQIHRSNTRLLLSTCKARWVIYVPSCVWSFSLPRSEHRQLLCLHTWDCWRGSGLWWITVVTSSKLEGNTQPGPLLEGWLYSWQSPAENAHRYSYSTAYHIENISVYWLLSSSQDMFYLSIIWGSLREMTVFNSESYDPPSTGIIMWLFYSFWMNNIQTMIFQTCEAKCYIKAQLSSLSHVRVLMYLLCYVCTSHH